jgi:hypothetical protein
MRKTQKKDYRFTLIILISFLGAFLLGTISYFYSNNYSGSGSMSGISGKSEADIALMAQEECNNSPDKNHCYPQFFYDLTKKTEHKRASLALIHLQKLNPQDTRGCHFIAHKISQAEVEKNPKNWENVLREVSPSLCTGGFLHGVLEVHAGYDPEFEINNETVTEICRNMIGLKSRFGERSCYHSMGHLLLMQKEGEIDPAVNQCDTIKYPNARYECLSGAFMETITQENLLAHGYVAKRDPWDREKALITEKLCSIYSGMAAKACWKEISFLYFAIHVSDPIGLYNECQTAPNQEMRDECFIYGAGNVVHTTRFDQKNLVKVCHQFPIENPLFRPCMTQIIGSLLTGSTDNLDKVLDLCDQTYDSFKQMCYPMILGVLQRNNESKSILEKACGNIPKDIRNQFCA